jgi:hypothetical protein
LGLFGQKWPAVFVIAVLRPARSRDLMINDGLRRSAAIRWPARTAPAHLREAGARFWSIGQYYPRGFPIDHRPAAGAPTRPASAGS